MQNNYLNEIKNAIYQFWHTLPLPSFLTKPLLTHIIIWK